MSCSTFEGDNRSSIRIDRGEGADNAVNTCIGAQVDVDVRGLACSLSMVPGGLA